ncbi:glycoside hydrolase family 6 protein [Actinoplanes palleronii]|uniref:Glucanase n=1 Tax=Actinoplanes palleronii TaxID=113570 RepID=A0ABQ4B8I1_9ACTN|nr:glycoside hydrolase family 6 protein [Actinoplanes palleronii]GIE66965.1 glucanase [Actinoplanes palleronii]
MARHLYKTGRLRNCTLVTAVVLATAAVTLLRDRDPMPPVRVPEAAPLDASVLYVDPTGAAADHLRTLRRAGRTVEAALVRRIAARPVASWFTDSRAATVGRARQLVTAAARARRLPVLVLYNIPHRDCAGHSAGGAADAPSYRKWVSSMAAALRGHHALVILEPDAVAHALTGCLGPQRAAERLTLLAGAIDTLRALPGVRIYLDAGNPTWVPAARMAPALRRAGATRARGFALNVANFETTTDNMGYGMELSKLLGGAHFVIDTSRNGNGPARRGAGDRHWCNPPGRRLGHPPTMRTGNTLADAYLWVKRPGESDGACGGGAPPAGQWYPSYALGLAR